MIVLLFESVREILFNVVKHAAVDKAHVDVRCIDGEPADQRSWTTARDSIRIGTPRGLGVRLRTLQHPRAARPARWRTRNRQRPRQRNARDAQRTGRPGVVLVPSPDSDATHPHSCWSTTIPSCATAWPGCSHTSPTSRSSARPPNGRAAIELAAKLIPDVVLIDVNMSGHGRHRGHRLIRERLPSSRSSGCRC